MAKAKRPGPLPPSAWPEQIGSVEELEEVLSRPSAALVEAMHRLSGDLLILGAGGKVGPTLARLAKRAVDASGVRKRVYAVDVVPLPALAEFGIETLTCDLLDLAAVDRLPKVDNVVFMAGRKFGSSGNEALTWAINVVVPYHVARAFTGSRIAVFSTGCVYPVADLRSGGSTEEVPPDPVGEYAMSCLGRERMFDFFSGRAGERVALVRLNYALELRYGVLVDVATKVWKGEPVDVTTGFANGIWQGDACDQVLRSLELAASPPRVLNVTGPELFSVREVAQTFGRLLGREVRIVGEENGRGYLSNARLANSLFGNPSVPLGTVIRWTAEWVRSEGQTLGKPTHFETQNGRY